MSKSGRVLLSAAILGLTLAACGGGNSTQSAPDRTAGQGVAVGAPNGSAPVFSDYVRLAQDAACASVRNRLFLIDAKYVLWDRAGDCPDNAYAQTLMGATPQAVLCTSSDTIAGPRTSCSDPGLRPLFDTMMKNLDKPDLGLGADHKVEALSFQPGDAVNFISVVNATYSNIATPRQAVVRDGAAWAALWAEHSGSNAALPQVDFTKQMVVGVFLGARPNGCYRTDITEVALLDGKLAVSHTDTEPGPGTICTMAITYPAHLVIVPRTEAPVAFVRKVRTLQ
jgi:hypothetical protein